MNIDPLRGLLKNASGLFLAACISNPVTVQSYNETLRFMTVEIFLNLSEYDRTMWAMGVIQGMMVEDLALCAVGTLGLVDVQTRCPLRK